MGLQTLLGGPTSHSSHHPHNIRKNLLSVISTTKADSRYSDNFTTKHTSISHIRAEHTPDPTLSLSGPSHNISQYLRRFPSYDLQLTTYDFPALLYWDPPPPTTNNHQQSLTQFNCSLRLVTTRLTFNRSLRLTTYDFLAGTHHHQQPPATSQHLRRFPSYDLRLTTS